MNQIELIQPDQELLKTTARPNEALPLYYPALDGLRAFSVFFVIFEHITVNRSPLNHFHGWLGVDIFFVLSGFLITGLLFREEKLTGTVDMAGFYIRRAFRILPLYWLVLAMYVVMLQPASQIAKWAQMKAALPYFLTFNNDIPLVLMPDKVGTIFGLSWTLGIEEKFYFFWPLICFLLLSTLRKRMFAGWTIYAATLTLTLLSFKMGRAYSGLIVGAILAMIFSSTALAKMKPIVTKIPATIVLALLVLAFWLVDLSEKNVFVFSWIVALLVASVLLKPSWLSRLLSLPFLVWLGKRSYAMYLIQGFGIEAILHFLKPKNAWQEILIAIVALGLSSLGATILHRLVEEPARRYGKKVVEYRKESKAYRTLLNTRITDPDAN